MKIKRTIKYSYYRGKGCGQKLISKTTPSRCTYRGTITRLK